MSNTLTFALKPTWEEIDGLRQEAEAFLSQHIGSADSLDATLMVTSELVENAIKYGKFGANDQVRVVLERSSEAITVEVRHRIDSGGGVDLERLDRMVQWIRGHQDPFEAYVRRLQEVSGQSLDSRESGLGLVRIAYEGQAELDFFVDRDMLTVSAIHQL